MPAGLDTYRIRARWAPALLAATPAVAVGVALLPLLPGAQKLWSILGLAVPTFAALVARRAGNQIQPDLWASWGGPPSLAILRFKGSKDPVEIERRHRHVEAVLGGGLRLPTADEELVDPVAADGRYSSALDRLRNQVRGVSDNELLNVENRNYGFARNLMGLRPWGERVAWIALFLAIAGGLTVAVFLDWRSAIPFLLPTISSLGALIAWRFVDSDFVQPSAQAYADRLAEAIDGLPGS